MRLPEPAVGAVDMHRSAARITWRALQHGFKVLNERANMLAVDSDKSAGSDGLRWIDSRASGTGLHQGFSQKVSSVEHPPFVGFKPVGNSVESGIEVLAEIQIILEDQDGSRPLLHGITHCLQMAHETTTHAGGLKTRRIKRLAGFKERQMGRLEAQADMVQLLRQFDAPIRPAAQVDDADCAKKGIDFLVAVHVPTCPYPLL